MKLVAKITSMEGVEKELGRPNIMRKKIVFAYNLSKSMRI